MSESKHTSGPWSAQRFEFDDGTWEAWDITDASGHKVPLCSLEAAPQDDIKANALLFSTALDYHAVALELDRLSLVLESAVRHSDPRNHDATVSLIRANRAAIAKATGATQ